MQFAVPHHLPQLLPGPGALGFVLDLLDEAGERVAVGGAVEEHAGAGQVVTAGASGFLVVALQGLGQVVVHDQPHVRLVDAHAEGDGGRDDPDLVANEAILGRSTNGRFEASVVGQCLYALVGKVGRQVLGVLAGEAVDDGRSVRVLTQQLQQRLERPSLGPNGVRQILTVEARNEPPCIRYRQLLHDVVPHLRGGRGGEGHDRRVGKAFAQDPQVAVVGAEVVAPLGNAVSLINGDLADPDRPEKVAEAGHGQSLRGDVEDLQAARPGFGESFAGFARRHRAVDEGRRNPVGAQGVHLVLHQGDQGGNDQRQTVQTQGG